MKKTMCMVLMSAGVLAGCVSQSPREIPVVESGTRLSSGPLRDVGAAPAPVVSQPVQDSVITVMTPPEAGTPAFDTVSVPAAPIQADVFSQAPSEHVEAMTQSGQETVAVAGQALTAPVQSLLTTAQQQRAQGDLNGAASSLERALRIAPQEPQVLYRLSEIRLMQGDAAQSEQLAQRGLTYSSGRPALQAGLWDLIAEAREKQGNTAGAAEARQKSGAFM